MYKLKLLALFLLTGVSITACGQQAASTTTSVSGTIIFEKSAPLPEDAVVQVHIQDTSLVDAPATAIGEQTVTSPGQFPIPHKVSYDPDQIQDNHTCTMSARITDENDNLLYINDTAIPVITRDSPTENVEIPVIQVGG